ncbi:MAG: YraN family protein [Candidatus Bipolaricaulota bacterium]
METKKDLGQEGEDEACRVLRSAGYEIVARNWRSRFGELDVVAREGDVLVFVEVKSRADPSYGGPEAAVGRRKQRRLIAAAKGFLAATGCELAARFDVVAMEGETVRIVRDAFQVDDDDWAAH